MPFSGYDIADSHKSCAEILITIGELDDSHMIGALMFSLELRGGGGMIDNIIGILSQVDL